MERTINTSAWTNVSEIEIVYKSNVKAQDRPQITSSQDAYEIFIHFWDDNKIDLLEQCKILLLNRSNRVLGVVDVAVGGLTNIFIDPRIILATALKAAACGLVLAHSHPSGSTIPSRADKDITNRLVSFAKLIEINVLDHIIVTRDQFYSFADEGLI